MSPSKKMAVTLRAVACFHLLVRAIRTGSRPLPGSTRVERNTQLDQGSLVLKVRVVGASFCAYSQHRTKMFLALVNVTTMKAHQHKAEEPLGLL